jgi:hypothetical protein
MYCFLLLGEERVQLASPDWKPGTKDADVALLVRPVKNDGISLTLHRHSPNRAHILLHPYLDINDPLYKPETLGYAGSLRVEDGSLVAVRIGFGLCDYEPVPHAESEYLTMPILSVSLYLTLFVSW